MARVFFLIRSLDVGGAERQLLSLARGLDPTQFESTIATYYPGGRLEREASAIEGVRVLSLGKQGRWDLAGFLVRLVRAVRGEQPAILHGYMAIANELCLLIGRALGIKVVWGLRASTIDFFQYGWIQGMSFRLGAWLSRFPDLIIVNSRAGREHCVAKGYSGERMVVIPNGIDTDRYRRDEDGRRRVRAEWGITGDELVVGMAARLDPVKDHRTFLEAAVRVVLAFPTARFVCVGDGPADYRERLRKLSRTLGLERHVTWAGSRDDMAAVFSGFDVSCLTSVSEGFPNVVGEAMASAVPCVVTDAGDAAWVVGETGVVCPVGDPERFAEGILEMLHREDREQRGVAARERIEQNFSMLALGRATGNALQSILNGSTCG